MTDRSFPRYLLAGMLLLAAGCSKQSPMTPTPTTESGAPATTTEPQDDTAEQQEESRVEGYVVTGPRGCVEAKTLPRVVRWTIQNVPADARVVKAYAYDDSVNCYPTIDNLRTQNDHLRWRVVGSTMFVEFDRDTFVCKGRQQVDIEINGVVVIGVVIRRPHGKANCWRPKPPAPPPVPLPIPPVPVPVPPPTDPPTPPDVPPTPPVPPDNPPPPPPPPPDDEDDDSDDDSEDDDSDDDDEDDEDDEGRGRGRGRP